MTCYVCNNPILEGSLYYCITLGNVGTKEAHKACLPAPPPCSIECVHVVWPPWKEVEWVVQ